MKPEGACGTDCGCKNPDKDCQFSNLNELVMEEKKWISVKQELPPHKTRVILFGRPEQNSDDSPNAIYTGVYNEEANTWHAMGYLVDNVTHWMPLMEPPK